MSGFEALEHEVRSNPCIMRLKFPIHIRIFPALLYPLLDIFQLTIAISDANMDIQTTDDRSAQLKRGLV